MENLQYKLEIEPKPTPRPRLGRNGNTFNPPEYTKYKKSLGFLLKGLKIPSADYSYVRINFYFTYPQSTPKKNRINQAPMRYKYDIDNLLKAIFDAMQEVDIIKDDRMISGVYAEKLFTTENNGWIEFELE